MKRIFLTLSLAALVTSIHAQQPPPTQPPAAPPQQPSDVATTITGDNGAPPRLAVPDFIAVSNDAESVAIAKTLGQVLFEDLMFEREFLLIPRDVPPVKLRS